MNMIQKNLKSCKSCPILCGFAAAHGGKPPYRRTLNYFRGYAAVSEARP
jgi:hypothetical protein